MNNNKFFYIVVGLTAAMLLVGVGGKLFVDKVADVVVDKLKKGRWFLYDV